MKRTLRACLVSVAAAIVSLLQIPVSAQNNPYKIDDEVYEYYNLASTHRTDSVCLAYVDTAKFIAINKSDDKGWCVASCAALQYYFSGRDLEALSAEAEKLRTFAKKSGYMQYYYHAYTQEVLAALNNHKSVYALDLAKKEWNDAQEMNDDYGIYQSNKCLAGIYQSRNDNASAIKYLKQAEDIYWKTDLKQKQSISQTYATLSELYPAASDSALLYSNKALEFSKTNSDKVRAILHIAICYGARNDRAQFYRYYTQFCSDPLSVSVAKVSTIDLYVYDAIFRGDYDGAYALCDDVDNPVDRYTLKSRVASSASDWKSAAQFLELKSQVRDSLNAAAVSSDLAEYNSKFETDNLIMSESQKLFKLYRIFLLSAIFVILCSLAVFLMYRMHKKRQLAELARLNEELDAARNAAEHSSQMKDLFVQNMSHEVRTPLNAILGFSQLLSTPGMEWSDEERSQFGDAIMNNGNVLTMLIDDILNASDMEKGNYRIVLAENSVKRICDAALESVRYRVPDGVELKLDYPLDDDLTIVTDAGCTQQILINYLTNACKHTEKGTITLGVSLTEYPDMLTFSVTDTGTGVPADQAENIFERFTKLDAFKQGTGLGLNICRILSSKLCGKALLDTTYTDGARFLFIHPLNLKVK